MSDSDLLKRAAQTLREEHSGQRTGAGFTRARVMKSLHQRRRHKLLWWSTLTPAAAILLGGSAWAQATGHWPQVWHNVVAVFSVVARHDGVAISEPGKQAPSPRQSSSAVEMKPSRNIAPPPAEEPEHSNVDSEVPKPLPAPTATVKRKLTPTPPRLAQASRPHKERPPASAAPEAPAPPPTDPELSHFRRAHDAHYRGGSPSTAILKYEEYLRAYPNGRFGPEARYNIALNLVKLGRIQEAQKRLQPFADGAYGDYRRRQASELLNSLK